MDTVNQSHTHHWANSSVAECRELHLQHVKLSPYAHDIEAETIAWMHAFGLIPDPCYLEKVRRMAVWGYAGFSHPFASYEQLLLYSKYITLWLLWDDLVMEKETDLNDILNGVASAFRWADEPLQEQDQYIRAWRSIIDGYKNLGVSSHYIARLRRKMMTWVRTVASENHSIYVKGQVSPWVHLRRRLITIGVIPTAQLIDVDIADMDQLPAARRVVMVASAIVAMVNELVSVEKDADRVNLVVLIQNWYGCNFESAYDCVIGMCRAELAKLPGLVQALPAGLQAWGVLMQHMAEGFSYWHFVCPRYDHKRIACRLPFALPEVVRSPTGVAAVVTLA
ncbi:hypothetical protein DWU98_05885 [Dyella monticola]|uniref:Terpene synthase n=1 Tax=Dyella monticola TaxID=1927958 RepID=A0A370X654_9GAMM|nr:hypothetical protein [Dyella monticola]RDS83836.1 hypothetical protein DWU98_05885 [Dyella monticola]